MNTFRIRRHGALYDITLIGRKVGRSFHNRETAYLVVGWCKRAVKS